MGQPYVGEIRMFAGSFPPLGWELCHGQPWPISENETLFQLIGTTYGGDGTETFNLPDLRGRLPVHQGNLSGTTFTIGQAAGVEEVTLTVNQIPGHSHALRASTDVANESSPAGNVLAQSTAADLYIEDFANASLDGSTVLPAGGSQPHTNVMPYLCVNYIISMFGIFPTQS